MEIERSGRLFQVVLCSLVSICYLSPIRLHESDLFFLTRMGEEVAKNHRFFVPYTWSFLSPGNVWSNYEWLTSLVYWVISQFEVDRFVLLPVLRAFLVYLLSFQLCNSVRAVVKNPSVALFASLILIPVYLSSNFIMLRAELFVLVIWANLISYWLKCSDPFKFIRFSILSLLLWSNFHAGTSPFGIMFSVIVLFFDPRFKRIKTLSKIIGALGVGLTWFLTPIGTNIISIVLSIGHSSFDKMIENFEMQPFSLKLFQLDFAGLSFYSSVYLTIVAVFTVLVFRKRGTENSPLFLQGNTIYIFGTMVLALSIWKVRFIRYLLVLEIPIAAVGLEALWMNYRSIFRPIPGRWVLTSFALLSAMIFAIQVNLSSFPLGFGLAEKHFPTKSIWFLSQVKLQPRLLNDLSFGSFLMDRLRDYPIFTTSSAPTDETAEFLRAGRDPVTFQAFLKKYQISLSLKAKPKLIPFQTGFTNSDLPYFPKEDWALVFFDNISVVYAKRNPANLDLINKFEYHLLLFKLPAYLGAKITDTKTRNLFELELDRCLTLDEKNIYCLVGKATFLESRGDLRGAETLRSSVRNIAKLK